MANNIKYKEKYIMKRYLDKLTYIVFAVVITLIFSACSDEEFNKWGATYAYIIPEKLTVMETDYTLYHSDVDGITGDTVRTSFTVSLNKLSDVDRIIDLALELSDEELKDYISFSENPVIIPAGSMTSKPITVFIPKWDFAKNNKSKTEYSVKVKLAPKGGADFLANLNSEIGLSITKHAVPTFVEGTPSEGTLIKDHSTWEIIVDPRAEEADNPGNLIDGDNDSGVAFDGENFEITVDFGTEMAITGIGINTWWDIFAPKGMELYTSDDGKSWISQGFQKINPSETMLFKLIKPITCKHIKFDLSSGAPDGYINISELSVYAK